MSQRSESTKSDNSRSVRSGKRRSRPASKNNSISSQSLTLKTDNPDSLILAERIRDIYKEGKTLMKGSHIEQYLRAYRRQKPIRILLTVASLVLMFFSKPPWCEANPNVTEDCKYNTVTKVTYLTNTHFFLNSQFLFLVHVFTMGFITYNYQLKMKIYSDIKQRRRKNTVKLIIISVSVLGQLLRYFYPRLPFSNITFIVFLVYHSKLFRRTIHRIWIIFKSIQQILFLQLLVILIFAYFIRLITFDYGDKYYDNQIYYSYNYSSFWKIFITLLYLQTLNNFPDCFILDNYETTYVMPVIGFNCIFTVFIIQSVLIGVIEEKFTSTWIKDIEDIQENEEVMQALNQLENYRQVDMELMKKRILRAEMMKDLKERTLTKSFSHDSLDDSFETLEYNMDMNTDKIDYNRKNSIEDIFKGLEKKSKRRIRLFSLILKLIMTLSPILTNGEGKEKLIYLFSLITSLIFMAKFLRVLSLKGLRYLAYSGSCIEFLSLLGIILSSLFTLYFVSEGSETSVIVDLYYI